MSGLGAEAYPIMIEKVADGAAVELFNSGVKLLLADLDNPMKKPEAKRSFGIQFTFEASDESAQDGKWTVELVRQKLAPSRAFSQQLMVSRAHGQTELLGFRQGSIELPNNVLGMETPNAD